MDQETEENFEMKFLTIGRWAQHKNLIPNTEFLFWRKSNIDTYLYLDILPSVKEDVLRLNFPVLYIHLIATEYHMYVTAYPVQVSVPNGHIPICGGCSYIKHQYGTVTFEWNFTNLIFKSSK